MLYWIRSYLETKLPPEDGGGLSQTQSFNDSLMFIKNEFQQWDTKLGINRGK